MRTILNPIPRIIWHLSLFLLSFTFAIITQNLWLSSLPSFAQPSAQIAILNSFTPGTTNAGINSTYRLLFRNSTGSPITITNLNRTFLATPSPAAPGTIFIASTSVSANTCDGTGTVILTPGTEPNIGGGGGVSGSYNVSGFTIPNGSTGCFIEFPVRAYAAGNHTETIPKEALTTSVGSNADTTSATLQINSSAAATLAKSFGTLTIPGDGRSLVTITITNPNNFPLTGTTNPPTLVDALPSVPSQLFVDTRSGAPAPATSCTGGTASISTDLIYPANSAVQLVGGTIPANGNCNITFPVTSAVSGTYTNAIAANSLSTQNRITSSNAPDANLAVQNSVTITKAGLGNNLAEGVRQRIVITINNGGSQLTGLSVTDPLGTLGYLEIDPNPDARTTCIAGGANTVWANQPIAGETSFTFNSAALGPPAIVPAANPTTNALGSCTISVNVRVRIGARGNLPNPEAANADTNTISNTIANFNNDQGRLPTDPATDAFSVISGLTMSKQYFNASSPTVPVTTIAPGSTVQVRIRVRYLLSTANSTSPPDLTGLSYTDTLPTAGGQRLIVANPPNASFSASCGAATFNPLAGDTSVTLSNARIIPSANPNNDQNACDIFFDVQAPDVTPIGANFDNVIDNNTILNDQGFDSNAITGTEGRLTTVSRVNITKSFTPSSVGRGLPSQLTITIQNNRRSIGGTPESLTQVAITDDLTTNTPIPNLQVADPPSLNNTCGGTITGATSGSTSVSLFGGTINPNASCTIQFNVIEINRTNVSFPTPVSYTNRPSAFSNLEDETATLPSATLTVTSPLTGIKSFQSPVITANGISRGTIEFINSDLIPLNNLSFTDSWAQANTQIALVPAFDTTCGGNFTYNAAVSRRSFSFAGGQVPAQVGGVSGRCRVSFDVVMDDSGSSPFTNTLLANTVTTAEGFRNPANISGPLARITHSLTILKSFNPLALLSVGDPSILTVTIGNPAASGLVANNLTFVDTMDTLSSEILVFPVPSATTSCGGTVLLPGSPRPAGYAGAATLAANEFGLTGGIIPAGGSCVITIRTTRNTVGNRTNVIPAANLTTREGVTNNTPTSSTLNALPALDVTKAFLPNSIAGAQISRLTVTIRNRQASGQLGGPLTNIRFTDDLPANVRVAASPNTATTCTNGVTEGVFDPPIVGGATTFTFTSFDLAFNSSCTVSIDVTSNIANSYLNSIPTAKVEAALQTSLNTVTGNPLKTTSNDPAEATLTVTSDVLPPEIVLVKRITRINGNDILGFNPDGTGLDTDAKWPSPTSDSLRGAVTVSNVRPKDEVEYTVYYLNRGKANAENVRICDPVPANTVYIANAFNGSTPTDGGLPADLGIALQTGTTVGDRRFLTGANDAPDRGRYYDPALGEVPAAAGLERCPDPNNPAAPITTNPNGLVAVNVTRTTGAPTFPSVPNATGAGVPPTSYGFVRFRVRVR